MKLLLSLITGIASVVLLTGAGCQGEGGGGESNQDEEVGVFHVGSIVRSDVTVKSGDLSETLETGKCVGVKEEQWAGLEISAGDTVLCGGSAEGATPCTMKHTTVDWDGDNKKVILSDSTYTGCAVKLEPEEEAEAGAESGGAGASPEAGAGGAAGANPNAGGVAAGGGNAGGAGS